MLITLHPWILKTTNTLKPLQMQKPSNALQCWSYLAVKTIQRLKPYNIRSLHAVLRDVTFSAITHPDTPLSLFGSLPANIHAISCPLSPTYQIDRHSPPTNVRHSFCGTASKAWITWTTSPRFSETGLSVWAGNKTHGFEEPKILMGCDIIVLTSDLVVHSDFRLIFPPPPLFLPASSCTNNVTSSHSLRNNIISHKQTHQTTKRVSENNTNV